jgi:hypothetical protein
MNGFGCTGHLAIASFASAVLPLLDDWPFESQLKNSTPTPHDQPEVHTPAQPHLLSPRKSALVANIPTSRGKSSILTPEIIHWKRCICTVVLGLHILCYGQVFYNYFEVLQDAKCLIANGYARIEHLTKHSGMPSPEYMP